MLYLMCSSGASPTTCRWWCEFRRQIMDWSDVWFICAWCMVVFLQHCSVTALPVVAAYEWPGMRDIAIGDIAIFLYFANLAWKCLFTPLLGGCLGTFPPNDVTHRRNPKRPVLWPNHVIYAIEREYWQRGSSSALDRDKRQYRMGQEKSHRGL